MLSDVRIFEKLKLLGYALCLLAAMSVGSARAATAHQIDASVDAVLSEFRKSVQGASEYLEIAKGVLVVPDVKKVGFIVGGQWGYGALRVEGKTVDYYKMMAGSIGFQAGVQQANYVFMFMTDDALESFRRRGGWDAGIETGITVVDQSIGLSADTMKAKSAVLAFVFGKEGLMGGYSLKGQKLSRFTPEP